MNNNIIEAISGIFVLIIAGLFAMIAYDASKISVMDGPHYVIKASFERIDGIQVGSVVKVAGVNVGRVASTKLDDKTYRALVEIFVAQDIKIPTDSSAEITSSGFLGDKYISITPGGDEDMLSNHQEIALTQSAVSFESLLAKFMFSNPAKSKGNG